VKCIFLKFISVYKGRKVKGIKTAEVHTPGGLQCGKVIPAEVDLVKSKECVVEKLKPGLSRITSVLHQLNVNQLTVSLAQ
jgi:hypothetical protein